MVIDTPLAANSCYNSDVSEGVAEEIGGPHLHASHTAL